LICKVTTARTFFFGAILLLLLRFQRSRRGDLPP
jgi:hypothetical protein